MNQIYKLAEEFASPQILLHIFVVQKFVVSLYFIITIILLLFSI